MVRLERLPGMEAGRRGRNLVVGIGYLLAVPIAIAALPLLALGVVATNYRGIARRLSDLPGITHGGGTKAGVVAGAYAFVLWAVVLSVVVSGSFVGAGPGEVESESGSTPETTPDSGSESPNETATDEADAADDVSSDEDTNLSDGEIVVLFETTVERQGIDIAAVEQEDDVLHVEFHQTATTESAFFEQAGYLSGAYVGAVGEGLETDRMEATMLNRSDGSPTLSWDVESEWAREYHDDERTIDDVIQRSLSTLEESDGDATGNDSQQADRNDSQQADENDSQQADGDTNLEGGG